MDRRVIVILWVWTFSLFGCGKVRGLEWFTYRQTYCSDPWPYGNNITQLKQEVVWYLEDKGIYVKGVTVEKNARKPESCLACSCKNGTFIKVWADEAYTDSLLSIGFTLK